MKKNIIITIIGTIIILLSINSNESSNNNAFALTYSNNVDLEYTFAPTLDVSFSSNNGSSFNGFIIEDLTPGTAAYSNTVTVTASSNNSDGFTMSATVGKASNVDSYRNNSRLVHSNNTNYFESIATNANLSLDNLGTNKWGYAICTTITNNECSTWSNYNGLPVIGTAENPTTGTTLAETDSAGSTSVDMRIGASSTNTQVSGTFTNDINFTITARIVTYDYTITYLSNNPSISGTVTNMPSNVSSSLNTGEVLLADETNTTPILSGYAFAGWCDNIVTGNTCNGNTYQSNDYLKLTNAIATGGGTNSINLTALWQPYMQDFTLADCQNMATDTSIIAIDRRDNNDYTVRYINGGCWMLDNLALDITEIGLDVLIENTNASEHALSCLKTGTFGNVACVTPYANKAGSYYDAPNIATKGVCNDSYPYCFNYPQNGKWASSFIVQEQVSSNENLIRGKIGAYYNYCAASAGSFCYTQSNGIDKPDTLLDVQEDICPRNWRMPTGSEDGEWQNLYNKYNNADSFRMALSAILSGYFDFSDYTANNQSTRGYLWSVTTYSGSRMHGIGYNATSVTPSNNYSRISGLSVRCKMQ